jgi:hypothetical protein
MLPLANFKLLPMSGRPGDPGIDFSVLGRSWMVNGSPRWIAS